jgi:hypothetical protein
MNARYLLTTLQLSLAAVVLAAVSVSQAHAQDSKIYPGLMCVDRGNTGYAVYDTGTIGNDSTTNWLLVGCPIVRDGVSISSGWMQVLDRNSDKDIVCRVVAGWRSGNVHTGYWFPRQSSAAVGGVQLSYGSGSVNSLAHLYYSCDLPPRTASGVSMIVTYSLTEK